MERTALRLATVATLLNGGTGPPWPTMVGDFVYDSVLDDILEVPINKKRAVIIVRTDEDRSAYKLTQFAGRQVRLLIEISMITGVVDETGQSRPDWPKTDPALELMLDGLEWQVWVALFGHGDWAEWFHEDCGYKVLLGYSSMPRYSAPERGATRLAVRTLEFVFNMSSECIEIPLNELAPVAPDFLPPSIVKVVNKIMTDGGGDLKKAVTGLGRTLVTYIQKPRLRYPAFQRVWSDLSQYDIEASWQIEQTAYLEQVAFTLGAPILGTPDLQVIS